MTDGSGVLTARGFVAAVWGVSVLVAVVAAVVVFPRTVTKTHRVPVVDPRPRIRDNVASEREVRANFAGKPAESGELPGGWRCGSYGSRQRDIDATDGRPAWVVKICYREPTS